MWKRFLLGRIKGFRCAAAGVVHVARTQRNAWLHLAATVLVVVAGAVLRVSIQEWCWLFAGIGAVWMAEAFNTAIELLADAAVPGEHPLVGRAKDVAAGGVLVTAATALAVGVCVLGPHLGAVVRGWSNFTR